MDFRHQIGDRVIVSYGATEYGSKTLPLPLYPAKFITKSSSTPLKSLSGCSPAGSSQTHPPPQPINIRLATPNLMVDPAHLHPTTNKPKTRMADSNYSNYNIIIFLFLIHMHSSCIGHYRTAFCRPVFDLARTN